MICLRIIEGWVPVLFVGYSHPQPAAGLAWQAAPLTLNAMALLPSPGLWKDPCVLLSGGGISAPCKKGPGTCAQSCWTSGPPLAVSHDPQPGAPQEWRCQLSIAVSFSAGLVREGSTSPSPWLPPTPPHPRAWAMPRGARRSLEQNVSTLVLGWAAASVSPLSPVN